MPVSRNTMDSVVDVERVIWESEQVMLPRRERDCTTCRGKGVCYIDRDWYHVLGLCSSCHGVGTLISMKEYRAQRALEKQANFAAAYGAGVQEAKITAAMFKHQNQILQALIADMARLQVDSRALRKKVKRLRLK